MGPRAFSLFLLPLLSAAALAQSAPPSTRTGECPENCRPFLDQAEIYRTALALLPSGLQSPDPQSPAHSSVSFEEQAAMSTAYLAWTRVPASCRQAVFGRTRFLDGQPRRFLIQARGTWRPDALSTQERAFDSSRGFRYDELFKVATFPCLASANTNAWGRWGSGDPLPEGFAPDPSSTLPVLTQLVAWEYDQCIARDPDAVQRGLTELLNLSNEEMNARQRAYWVTAGSDPARFPPPLTPEEQQVMAVYHRFLQAENSQAAVALLRQESARLSTEQKLVFLQVAGKRMVDLYDEARRDARGRARGEVNLEEIFQASRTSYRQGGTSTMLAVTPQAFDPAGVCRDIASAQGELARAMGLQEAYVVSYGVSGSHHVSLFVRDPDNPNRAYHINYDELAQRQTGSAQALQAANHETGIVYRIARPGGRIVRTQTNEFGRWIGEILGADAASTDPLARLRAQVISTDTLLTQGTRGSSTLRVGVGQDARGDQNAAASVIGTWGAGTRHPGRAGVALGVRVRDMPAQDDPDILAYAAFHFAQHFRPQVQLNERIRLQSDTSVQATGVVGPNFGENALGTNIEAAFDGDIRFTQELALLIGDLDAARGRLRLRAGAVASPGVLDIRNPIQDGIAVGLDLAYVGADGRVPLPRGLALTAEVLATFHDEFAANGRAQVGLEGRRFAVQGGVEGSLGEWTGVDLRAAEGSRRQALFQFALSPTPRLRVRAGGQLDLERDPETGERAFSVTGGLEAGF
jgi:hypothetical protein